MRKLEQYLSIESNDIPVSRGDDKLIFSSQEIPIIIINWNGVEDTLECIDSVLNSSYTNYKIYLIDNYSSDDSSIRFKNRYRDNLKVKLIFNKLNLGFTKATNVLLKNILDSDNIPPYVVLLNNDTIVQVGWLYNLILAAKNQSAAVVSSKMIDYHDHTKMDNAGHRMLNTGEILPIGHGRNPNDFNQSFENWGACAGACIYSTKMLKEIGLFDEYFQTGYEDAELGVRAILTGNKCIYEPKALVYHKMGSSIKKVFGYDYALSIQKNVLYAYFKLMPFNILALNFPFFIARYLFIILVQLLFFRIQHSFLLVQALWEVLFVERKKVIRSREAFIPKIKLSSFEIGRRQTFFLFNHLQRFYHYFILLKPSALDAYGKKK